MSSGTNKRCPLDLRERALRMVAESRARVSAGAGRRRIRRRQISASEQRRRCSTESMRANRRQRASRYDNRDGKDLRRLCAENRKPKRTNEILKPALAFFAEEPDRSNR